VGRQTAAYDRVATESRIVAFPVPITSVLTGATVAQLAYWKDHALGTGAPRAGLEPFETRSGRQVPALRAMGRHSIYDPERETARYPCWK
jgi:hypothetical protein